MIYPPKDLPTDTHPHSPGWTGPTATRPSALSRIAKALNRALSTTQTVIPVLETMAGAGGVIGNTFQDLAGIIAEVDDKSRIGVCLDTCHVFAAGYVSDFRTPCFPFSNHQMHVSVIRANPASSPPDLGCDLMQASRPHSADRLLFAGSTRTRQIQGRNAGI